MSRMKSCRAFHLLRGDAWVRHLIEHGVSSEELVNLKFKTYGEIWAFHKKVMEAVESKVSAF